MIIWVKSKTCLLLQSFTIQFHKEHSTNSLSPVFSSPLRQDKQRTGTSLRTQTLTHQLQTFSTRMHRADTYHPSNINHHLYKLVQ